MLLKRLVVSSFAVVIMTVALAPTAHAQANVIKDQRCVINTTPLTDPDNTGVMALRSNFKTFRQHHVDNKGGNQSVVCHGDIPELLDSAAGPGTLPWEPLKSALRVNGLGCKTFADPSIFAQKVTNIVFV